MNMIRVWQKLDLQEIENHIIIVDDQYGFCPGCKHTGIKYNEINTCPSCKRIFKYISTRERSDSPACQQIIGKIIKNAPELIIIDYNDYKHNTDKIKAHNLFGNL